MISITRIIDTIQSDWPLLASLALVGSAEAPAWALQSAQLVHTRLTPVERAACQSQLPHTIAYLALLRRHWTVTVILATLLALAVVAHAEPLVVDSTRNGILVAVLSTILLPPIAIFHGIVRDHIAAQSLLAVMRAPARA